MALSVSGVSAEVHGGRLSLDAHDGPDVMAAAGTGWVLGFTINVEAEYISTMGIGAGWTSVRLPATGPIAAQSVSTAVANVWLETPIDLPGSSWLTPQTALGAQTGGEGKVRAAHLDFGAVLKAGGTSLRVFVGPEFLSTRDSGTDAESSGWGVQGRIRLVQKFFPHCAGERPGHCL
jgi:hypothetical protein